MATNPNNQDPRPVGDDSTGVYGTPFGGRGMQPGLRKAEEDTLNDDQVARDVDAIAASGTDEAGTDRSTTGGERLNTDDGQSGRLDELK